MNPRIRHRHRQVTLAILLAVAGGLGLAPGASAHLTCAQLCQQCIASNPPKNFYIANCHAQYDFPNCLDQFNPISWDPGIPFGDDGYVSKDDDDWSTFMWANRGPGLLGVVVEATLNFDPIERVEFRLYNETYNSVEPFGTLLGSVDAAGAPFGQFQVEVDPTPYQGMDGCLIAEVYYIGDPEPRYMVEAFMTAKDSPGYDDFKSGVQGMVSNSATGLSAEFSNWDDYWEHVWDWTNRWVGINPWALTIDQGSSGYSLDDGGLAYLDLSGFQMADIGLVVPSTPFGLPIDHVEFRFYNESNNSFTPFGTLLASADGGGFSEGTFNATMDAGPLQGMDGALVGEVHLAAGGAGRLDLSEYEPKSPALADQEFPDAPDFSIYGVDDFSTLGQTWDVDTVRTYYTHKNGSWSPSITQGRLQVYPKNAPNPRESDKAPGYTVGITLIDHGKYWEAVADTSGIAELQGISGDYWIGLTPIADFATYGQEYHLTRANPGEDEDFGNARAYFRNPGNGFGLGTDWLPSDALFGEVSDLAFALDFHTVGEPPIEQVGLIYLTAKAKDCYPDFTGDGQLDLFDFLAFLNNFNAGGQESDCDGSGARDLFDFLCFVNAFNAGC